MATWVGPSTDPRSFCTWDKQCECAVFPEIIRGGQWGGELEKGKEKRGQRHKQAPGPLGSCLWLYALAVPISTRPVWAWG